MVDPALHVISEIIILQLKTMIIPDCAYNLFFLHCILVPHFFTLLCVEDEATPSSNNQGC